MLLPASSISLRKCPKSWVHYSFSAVPTAETHEALMAEVTKFTDMTYYGPQMARGRCPFHHPDNHPSFAVKEQWWRCFKGCLGADRSRGGLNAFRARCRERGLL